MSILDDLLPEEDETGIQSLLPPPGPSPEDIVTVPQMMVQPLVPDDIGNAIVGLEPTVEMPRGEAEAALDIDMATDMGFWNRQVRGVYPLLKNIGKSIQVYSEHFGNTYEMTANSADMLKMQEDLSAKMKTGMTPEEALQATQTQMVPIQTPEGVKYGFQTKHGELIKPYTPIASMTREMGIALAEHAERQLQDPKYQSLRAAHQDKTWVEWYSDPETRGMAWSEFYGELGPQLVFNVGAGIAGAMIARNPSGFLAGATIATGLQLPGEAVEEFMRAGADRAGANQAALIYTTIGGLLEVGPLGKLMSDVPGIKQAFSKTLIEELTQKPSAIAALRSLFMQMVLEGGTEGLQQFMLNIGKRVWDENQKLLEGIDEATFLGTVAGATLATPVVTTDQAIQRWGYAKKNKKYLKFLPTLEDNIAAKEASLVEINAKLEQLGNELAQGLDGIALDDEPGIARSVGSIPDVIQVRRGEEYVSVREADLQPGEVVATGFTGTIQALITKAEARLEDAKNTGQITLVDQAQQSLDSLREMYQEQETIEKSMVDAVKTWNNQYTPDLKIVLTDGLISKALGINLSQGRQIYDRETNTAYIEMGVFADLVKNGEFQWNIAYPVLAHEYGHALISHTFADQPKAVKKAIRADYRTWYLQKAGDEESLGDFLKFASTPESGFGYQRNIPEALGVHRREVPYESVELANAQKKAMAEAPHEGYNSELDYVLSFNEFLAEQIAKSAIRKDVTAKGKYFAKVRKRLRRFFGQYGENHPTSEVLDNFLVKLNLEAELEALRDARKTITPSNVNRADYEVLVEQSAEAEYQRIHKAWGMPYADDSLERWLGAPPSEEVKKALQDIQNARTAFGWGTDIFATILQIAKKNPHITPLQTYVKNVMEWNASIRDFEVQADQTLKRWRKLGKKGVVRVGTLAVEADRISFQKGRRLSKEELGQLVKDIGVNEKEFQFYQDLQKEFDNNLDALEEAMIADARRRLVNGTVEGEIAFELRKKEIQHGLRLARNRNYFPASRFGQFTLRVKATEAVEFNGKQYAPGEQVVFETFPTKRQAEKARQRMILRPEFRGAEVSSVGKMEPYVYEYTDLPPPLLDSIKELVPIDHHAALETAVINTFSGHNFLKRMGGKKGVEGASVDFQRSYVYYTSSFGRHLARLKYQAEMVRNAEAVEAQGRRIQDKGLKGADKRQRLGKHMHDHRDYILNPPEEWTGFSALAFNMYLAFIPAKVLLNAIQVPMVSYGWLAHRFGDAKAFGYLAKSNYNLMKNWWNPDQVPEHYVEAIRQAKRMRLIDQAYAHEVASVNAGMAWQRDPTSHANPSNYYRESIRLIAETGGYLWAKSELYARRSVFDTAYWLHLDQNPGDYTGAFETAKQGIQETLFEYEQWDRPQFMRGRLKPFLVFFAHIQHMLEHFAGPHPEKWRTLFMLIALGGIQGFPGSEDFMEILTFLSRQVNKKYGREILPTDIKEYLREEVYGLMEHVAHDPHIMTNLILDGGSKYSMGLGALGELSRTVGPVFGAEVPDYIPVIDDMPKFDLHASVSLGRVSPVDLGFLNAPDFKTKVETATTSAAGAGFGIFFDMARAVTNPPKDPMEFAKAFTPSAVDYWLTGAQAMKNGEYRDKAGDAVIGWDVNSPEHQTELMLLFLGLPPTRLQIKREADWAAKEGAAYFARRRSWLIADLEHAMHIEDMEAFEESLAMIKTWNKSLPDPGLEIRGDSISASVQGRMRTRIKKELGLPLRRDDYYIHNRIRGLYFDEADADFFTPAKEEEVESLEGKRQEERESIPMDELLERFLPVDAPTNQEP